MPLSGFWFLGSPCIHWMCLFFLMSWYWSIQDLLFLITNSTWTCTLLAWSVPSLKFPDMPKWISRCSSLLKEKSVFATPHNLFDLSADYLCLQIIWYRKPQHQVRLVTHFCYRSPAHTFIYYKAPHFWFSLENLNWDKIAELVPVTNFHGRREWILSPISVCIILIKGLASEYFEFHR